MTEKKRPTKSFPDQPAWNSGAALGAIAGLGAGMVAPLHSIAPQVLVAHLDGGAHFLVWAALGALSGMAIGWLFFGARGARDVSADERTRTSPG